MYFWEKVKECRRDTVAVVFEEVRLHLGGWFRLLLDGERQG